MKLGRRRGPAVIELGRRRFERSGNDLDLVDDLAEGRKLVAFELLGEYPPACVRIEHPVVIEVVVVVHVVIPQYRMPSGDPCGVPILYSTHLERSADVPGFELFVHF